MRYVIIRDDDTNALTPAAYLDRLYRPFIERGMPVNLAVIPCVRTDVTMPDGKPEGFLLGGNQTGFATLPVSWNKDLVKYLLETPGYKILQHGCHHDRFEFDRKDRHDIERRLRHGTHLLTEVGFPQPTVFVAPHDKFSRESFEEIAKRFHVISSGWFEWRRVPVNWLPRYALKKFLRHNHWHVGNTTLLSHPGCLLSYHHPYESMLERIRSAVMSRQVTVLVTHWWEYFRDGKADEEFISVLHETADWLASQEDVRVISFDDLARERVPLN